MSVNQIKIKIEKFKAIEEANIILDGITLVAGENGCGKSTISKFLYYAFKLSNEYDKLVDFLLVNNLKRYSYILYNFQYEIDRASVRMRIPDFNERKEIDKIVSGYRQLIHTFNRGENKDISAWIDYIDYIQSFVIRYSKINNFLKFERLERILKDVLVEKGEVNAMKFYDLLELLKSRIKEEFELAREIKERKPLSLLAGELKRMLSVDKMPDCYEISEYDSLIISDSGDSFIKAHTVQHVAYVDTPMLVGLEGTGNEYWNDLNAILHKEPKGEYAYRSINELISKDILHGEACKEEVNAHAGAMDAFVYKRDDGSEFNLLDCATGVKSFAIIQMMLKNGFLNKYTLLIIDEPESHLHPQWIIEYARLLVLLNKHIGVKFFIASHNPDMVSAIKYISEKENIADKVNYYIAKPAESVHSYKYTHLGTDIEPIFESFNIALDRINLYGTINEQDDEIL